MTAARDHVCLSSVDWGFLWQGHQELMARLAAGGGHVIFIENTGVRRPHLRDWRRLVTRLSSWAAATRGHFVPSVPRLRVISPLVLPFPWSVIARKVNRWLFTDRLPTVTAGAGLTAPVVWTFLPTPLAIDALRAFRGRRSLAVYYCIADFAQLADEPEAAHRAEDELLLEVDLVFTDGRVLQERVAGRHPRVIFAPFGVADHFFEDDPGPEPPEFHAIPRPRVGYIGGLHRHVDTGLLDRVTRILPDMQFVFVGPSQEHPWPFAARPNVHLLGHRPHRSLPRYIDAFDAAVVPYRLTPYTETVYPTKLHEYLARGKPVVSSPLSEVIRLALPSDVLRIEATGEGYAAALRAAVASAPEVAMRAREAARGAHWGGLVAAMVSEIERAITDATTPTR